MNVKFIEKAVNTVYFQNLYPGDIFADLEVQEYAVKIAPIVSCGETYNAISLNDNVPIHVDGDKAVVKCHHQINVWY